MKLYIIGTSGSGKTTLARRLAQTNALRHISLDDLYWKANWVESTQEEFMQKVRNATEEGNWIAWGNCRQVKGYLMGQVNLTVWLDYPFWRVFLQTFTRIINRTPIAGGNQEMNLNMLRFFIS